MKRRSPYQSGSLAFLWDIQHVTLHVFSIFVYCFDCKYGRKRLIRWSRVWRMMQNALIHPMLALEKWFRMIILWVLQMSSFSLFSLFAETWFSAFCIEFFPSDALRPGTPALAKRADEFENGQRILRDSSCTIKRQSVLKYDDPIWMCGFFMFPGQSCEFVWPLPKILPFCCRFHRRFPGAVAKLCLLALDDRLGPGYQSPLPPRS